MLEHLVRTASEEQLVEASNPSYCHMGRARYCNGWTRLPIKTEMSCPPVKLSFNKRTLSKIGATADDSLADKEWDHEACLTTRASGLKGARPNRCPATC